MTDTLEMPSEVENFLKFCFFRILRAIPVLLGVSFLVFLIFSGFTNESSVDIGTLVTQYLEYLQKVIFEQDFGYSTRFKSSVIDQISLTLPATLELVTIALILGYLWVFLLV